MLDIHPMRVLVAGGAGFLGTRLCERLLELGHEVLCVDNFLTGARANILPLLAHPGFELLRHDVCQPLFVEVDAIFNLACPASPVHYQRDPVQTLKTSVLGAINLLGLARRRGAPILLASSSEVYGDPLEHPQRERYRGHVNPIGPRACYDEGKRCAETLFADHHRQHGTDIRIARIFNTYGPRMRTGDGRVISNFISQALRGEPLTVYGDGSQTRSFCYVDDLIDALLRLMRPANPLHEPVNLGNPREVTVRSVAERIIALCDSPSGIEYHGLPIDDPKRRCPDISLANRRLNWWPATDLDTGLRHTISAMGQKLRIPAMA